MVTSNTNTTVFGCMPAMRVAMSAGARAGGGDCANAGKTTANRQVSRTNLAADRICRRIWRDRRCGALCAAWIFMCKLPGSLSVLDQRVDVVAGQFVASVQEGELDEEAETGDC